MKQRQLSVAIAIALGWAMGPSVVYAAAAVAQDAPVAKAVQPAVPPRSTVTNLETIKVTARRYQETLQDVPIAVTAFTARSLYDQNVQDLSDLQGKVPNLQIYAARGSNTTLTAYIRGIGQGDPTWGFDPAVGIYLDDAYIARPQGALLDVFDVERIEVLRGPQGTLYGKNTIGGAIKYISRPLPLKAEGLVDVTLGTHGEKDVKASYGNASADGVWRMRAAAATLHNDGYGHDLLTGSENSNTDTNVARVTVGFFPNARFNAQFEVDGLSDHSNPRGAQRLIVNKFDPARTPPLANPFNTQSGMPPVNLTNMHGAALTLHYTPEGNWEYKSITAYRGSGTNTNIDFDTLPQPVADVNATYHDHQFSQEFQALYDNGDKLHGVMGLYYFDGAASGRIKNVFLGFPPYTALGYATYASTGGSMDTRSVAAYADYSYQFDPRWSLDLGARLTHETKTALIQNYAYPNPGFATPSATLADFRGSTSSNNLSPKVTLGYEASDQVNLYATVSTGYHSGGYNIRANCALIPQSCQPIKDEKVVAYELGSKMSFFDGKLMMNTALFHTIYSDIQLSVFTSYTQPNGQQGFFGNFTNAGKGHIDGFEEEFAWQPVATWTLSGNVAYLHTKYTQFLNGGVNVASSQKFTNAPKWSGGLTLWKHYPLANGGEVVARLNASYQTKVYPETTLSELIAQPGYGLVNAGLIWRTGGAWTFSLQGSNLTNKVYRTTGYNIGALGIITGFDGSPRMVTASALYRFQ